MYSEQKNFGAGRFCSDTCKLQKNGEHSFNNHDNYTLPNIKMIADELCTNSKMIY